jgi:hypothetical protein
MAALSSDLRSVLARTITAARDAAEQASGGALRALAVDADRIPEHLGEGDRRLRVALRAEARQLGGFERLLEECAYERWHQMLFARFLADNELLIHPGHGVAVSLTECEEIARERGTGDLWVVASEFASTMLPGIFRSDDPVLELAFPPEGQRALEELLAGLPQDVFTSDDGLGWVYQYWQAKKKAAVDASGRKIGGADIAPVTQLFTEDYMVRFLLENTLGAWWAAKRPDSPLLKEWQYLRFIEDRTPAAGEFPGWPVTVSEITVIDPCCGSGHFLVTAFDMLRRMRMEAESLSAPEAGDAVLRDNVFGLELDARCTQIVAFALALAAWRTGGYRPLPVPNVGCAGISTEGSLEDWMHFARGDMRVEESLKRLHALLTDAADLGSLIDPLRETDGDLIAAQFDEVAPRLERALSHNSLADPAAAVFGSAAAGAAHAASLLSRRYTLVVTNPPFLTRRKQADRLKSFCERAYPEGNADLATCFIQRCVRFCAHSGTAGFVAPQNWLFLGSYERLRRQLLNATSWNIVVKLGPAAFTEMNWWAATTSLAVITNHEPSSASVFVEIDAQDGKWPAHKSERVRSAELQTATQSSQLKNPDARIVLDDLDYTEALGRYAQCLAGILNGDSPRFQRCFWELPRKGSDWAFQQTTVPESTLYGGRHLVILFDENAGHLRESAEFRRDRLHNSDQRGNAAWGKPGLAVSQMSGLPVSLYSGEKFDSNVAVILPKDAENIPAMWAFCESAEFGRQVRRLDPKTNVTNATITKVPFALESWVAVAASRYPNGLPQPSSSSPTEWLFNGHPREAAAPLHVAVARLVGYRWPRQAGSEFPDCPALGPDGLEALADQDGIMCLPPVRGSRPGSERLRSMLGAAFRAEWSSAREADLLAGVGYAGEGLEGWLRDGFFGQHSQIFRQRPFVWQIWDGRQDGFSALVNYHRLDRPMLERLTYTYLGDWIRQQRAAIEANIAGSELRLAAAADLQRRLQLIIDGAPPCDAFVR